MFLDRNPSHMHNSCVLARNTAMSNFLTLSNTKHSISVEVKKHCIERLNLIFSAYAHNCKLQGNQKALKVRRVLTRLSLERRHNWKSVKSDVFHRSSILLSQLFDRKLRAVFLFFCSLLRESTRLNLKSRNEIWILDHQVDKVFLIHIEQSATLKSFCCE